MYNIILRDNDFNRANKKYIYIRLFSDFFL